MKRREPSHEVGESDQLQRDVSKRHRLLGKSCVSWRPTIISINWRALTSATG
jgi:hypothetical protein